MTGYQYVSTYKTARTIVEFLSAIGWIIVPICGLGAFITAINLLNQRAPGIIVLLSLLPWAGGAVGGILVVGIGQLLRSNVDTADYTGETLAIFRALRGDILKILPDIEQNTRYTHDLERNVRELESRLGNRDAPMPVNADTEEFEDSKHDQRRKL